MSHRVVADVVYGSAWCFQVAMQVAECCESECIGFHEYRVMLCWLLCHVIVVW